ncbi:hypothetical protein EMPS_11493 [Entomortierella parvispora]|uniref:Myb-like domain-containing protein n=1 Tax=Entomortierella parvispora TaxID=205924 RepID=A0A9P3M272_9FUNG|nr:hypothetical protein EMPS_11493 [Entomortierella parvispora]
MRLSPQSRLFHVSFTNSFAKHQALIPQDSVSPAPESDADKGKATSTKRTRVPWTKDELDRLKYLYSDGKNPTIQSISSLFPGRSRNVVASQIRKIRTPIPRKNWSPEDKDRLLELYNAGVATPLEITTHFPGRTQLSITEQLNRLRPASYHIDRRRMISPLVLGDENGGDDHGSKQGDGAIITTERLRKPVTYWTEEEDSVLERLVQKAKERNLDRWSYELSLMLCDPVERQGLAMTRTQKSCIGRLERLQKQPFISKSRWTASEDIMLRKSVYSQLGIQLDSPSKLHSNTAQQEQTDDRPSLREDSKAALKKRREKERWPEIDLEQLKAVDWHRVALDIGTRTANSCRYRIDSHLKLKKGERWTKEEVERMREGLRLYGRDWAKVATVVGTKAASQVKPKYDYTLRKRNI